VTAYDDFIALKRRGFKPPRGRGRCDWCGFHVPTMRHRQGCPQEGK